MKAREVKREKLAKRYAPSVRRSLRRSRAVKWITREAWIALSKLPRNSNPIRQHNRCKLTGRPKGIYPSVRYQPYPVPRDGFGGSDPRREEGELVVYSSIRRRCSAPDRMFLKRGSSTEVP